MNSLSYVRGVVNDMLNSKKEVTSNALIKCIHPDINVRYNSVNVIVGKHICSVPSDHLSEQSSCQPKILIPSLHSL